MADKLKFALALALLAAGVVGFYLLSEQPLVLRVLSVLVGLGAGIAVASISEPGRRFIGFARESITETKKVVWPSRKETNRICPRIDYRNQEGRLAEPKGNHADHGSGVCLCVRHGDFSLADGQESGMGAVRPGSGLEVI